MASASNEKWPVFLLQAICDYQISENKQIVEMETFQSMEEIMDTNGFDQALILETSVVELDKEELKSKLGLNNYPLYVFPLTKAELDYSVKNNTASLLEIIHNQTSLLGAVNRKSVI